MGEITGRHFVQSGKAAGLGSDLIRDAITTLIERAPQAAADTLEKMPDDFAKNVHDSVAAALEKRAAELLQSLDEL